MNLFIHCLARSLTRPLALALAFTLVLTMLPVCGPNAFAAPAEQQPELLEGYRYDAPKSAIAAMPGMTEGTAEFAGRLVLQEISFAGLPWRGVFEFANERLVRISLNAPYATQRLNAVREHLRDTGYEALALRADGSFLDFLSYLKIEGPEALNAKVSEMLDKRPSRLTYAWFATAKIPSGIKRMSRNLTELLAAVDAQTREVELTVLTGKDGTALMLLDFTYPVLDTMRAKKKP